MHYSTGQNKMLSSLPRPALQNRLTAGLCHCKQTFGCLLIIQVCNDPISVHCSTGQDNLHFSLPRVAQHTCLTTNALQHWSKQSTFLTSQSCSAKQAVNKLVSLQIDLWVFAHHTWCSDPISVHCSTGQNRMLSSLPRAALQNRLTAGLCHCK